MGVPKVYTCSAVEKTGLREIWSGIEDFLKFTRGNGYYQRNRHRQAKYWMYETIHEALRESFYRNEAVESRIARYEELVLSDKKLVRSGPRAAQQLFRRHPEIRDKPAGLQLAATTARSDIIDSVPNVPVLR